MLLCVKRRADVTDAPPPDLMTGSLDCRGSLCLTFAVNVCFYVESAALYHDMTLTGSHPCVLINVAHVCNDSVQFESTFM